MKNGKAFRNIVLISQLAINVLVPTFLLLAIGLWIDAKCGTSYWAVVLLVLGILGGAKSAYDVAMNSIRRDEEHHETIDDLVEEYRKQQSEKNGEE